LLFANVVYCTTNPGLNSTRLIFGERGIRDGQSTRADNRSAVAIAVCHSKHSSIHHTIEYQRASYIEVLSFPACIKRHIPAFAPAQADNLAIVD
jgi:hypothetical protein